MSALALDDLEAHEDDARVLFERVPLTVTRELRALARRDWDFMRRMDPCDLKPLLNAIDDWLAAREGDSVEARRWP